TLHESNNLTSVMNARGKEVLSVDYDDPVGFGAKESVVTRRIAGTAETFTYKASDHSATYTDRRGHLWQFVHQTDGHPRSMTLPANDINDANPPATPPPALALPGGTVPGGPFTTATTYKDAGNRHHDGLSDTVTLPTGRNTSYGYEAPDSAVGNRNRANMTGETANGQGAKNALTDKYTYEPILNDIATHTDPTGGTTKWARDPQKGFANKITLPDSLGPDGTPRTLGSSLDHDASTGQAKSVKDFAGVGTTLEYFDKSDPAYGFLKTVTDKGDGSIYPVTAQSVTQFERDARGNTKSRTDPRGVTTTYEINEADQIVKITDAAATTSPSIPPLSIVRTFEYDADGNLVKETWPQAP